MNPQYRVRETEGKEREKAGHKIMSVEQKCVNMLSKNNNK